MEMTSSLPLSEASVSSPVSSLPGVPHGAFPIWSPGSSRRGSSESATSAKLRIPTSPLKGWKNKRGSRNSSDTEESGWFSSDGHSSAGSTGGQDFFGAKTLKQHRGFEPLCTQQQTDTKNAGEEQDADTLTVNSEGSELPRHSHSAVRRLVTEPKRSSASKAAALSHAILSNQSVQGFMIFLTVAILFCGDFIQCVSDVKYDAVLGVILYLCLLFFSLEWILNVLSSRLQESRYNCSLFFLLDLIATLSIGLDILLMEANNMMDNGPVARAARAARIGTRAGRSMRLLRLLRFLRLVRITRFVKVFLKLQDNQRAARRKPDNFDDHQRTEGSTRADTIGGQIAATSTRKVVIMTLLLLIVLPLLERNETIQGCNAEMVVLFQAIYKAPPVDRSCARMKAELEPWFGTGFVDFSQSSVHGLTNKGIIYAKVEGCVLYRDQSLAGREGAAHRHLAQRRRATEVQALPCDADWMAGEDAESTFLLYDMREEEIESAKLAMGFTCVVIVTLLGFSLVFSQDAELLANTLVAPISQLMQDMIHTSKLELQEVTPEEDLFETSVYEVRKLQEAYLNLNGAVGSFAKFTPLEVVRHFLNLNTEAKLGVSQRTVTIFFSDIAGFATICENISPPAVLSLLSEYFEAMVSIIVEEKGTMLEFIGDAILAIWNAPNSVPDHAVRSINTALRMNQVLEDLRQRWSATGKPDIRIRCGLHSASVFVGNLGSKMRMKYGVLGDGVNLASRLEELNKRYETHVLVSEDVLRQQGVLDSFYFRILDNVVVKGRHKPTAIYEALWAKDSAPEKLQLVAKHAQQAMESYSARDFEHALAELARVRELKDGCDPAGDVLAKRCRLFLEQPPPSDWDGSEVLKEKSFSSNGGD